MTTDQQRDFTERLKTEGMRNGELTIQTAYELVQDAYGDDWNESQLAASHARAATYCVGELVANHYESPPSEGFDLSTPSAYLTQFDLLN